MINSFRYAGPFPTHEQMTPEAKELIERAWAALKAAGIEET